MTNVIEALATIVKYNNEILKTIIKDTVEKNVANIDYLIEMIMMNCKNYVEIAMTIANGIVEAKLPGWWGSMDDYNLDEPSVNHSIEMIPMNFKHHIEIMMMTFNGIVEYNIEYHEMDYYNINKLIYNIVE